MTAQKQKTKIQPANDDFNASVDNLWVDPIALRNQQMAIQILTQQLCFLLKAPNYGTLSMYVKTLDVFEKRADLEGQSILDLATSAVQAKTNLSAELMLAQMPKLANRRPL